MWLQQLVKWQHMVLVLDNAHVSVGRSAPTLSMFNVSALRPTDKVDLDMAHANVPSKRTKHIYFKQHYIQEQVHTSELRLPQIPTAARLVDIFTKPLKRVPFTKNTVAQYQRPHNQGGF